MLSFPFPLRFLFANDPLALSAVLAVVQRALSTFMIRHSGLTVASGARSGAVTLIQRFGSAQSGIFKRFSQDGALVPPNRVHVRRKEIQIDGESMSQVQRQACATGQIEIVDELQAGYFMEGLLRLRRERFPMRVGKSYRSISSPLEVRKGDERHFSTPNSLRQ